MEGSAGPAVGGPPMMELDQEQQPELELAQAFVQLMDKHRLSQVRKHMQTSVTLKPLLCVPFVTEQRRGCQPFGFILDYETCTFYRKVHMSADSFVKKHII